MARPLKKGLSYFPFDVGTFSELGFRKLRYKFGPLGESVYLRLIALIYKNSYFLQQDFDDLAFAISDEIGSKWAKQDKIKSIILYCFEVELFDKNLMSDSVMTSREIQKIYVWVVARRKFKPTQYCLLTEQDYTDLELQGGFSETKTQDNATITQDNATITQDNATTTTQTKVNQTIQNETKLNERESAGAAIISLSNKQIKFKKTFPNKVLDCDIPEHVDVDLLIKKIKDSPQYLAHVPKLSFFIKKWQKVIANDYDNWRINQQLDNKIKGREYSPDELNSLFDKLDEVQI